MADALVDLIPPDLLTCTIQQGLLKQRWQAALSLSICRLT